MKRFALLAIAAIVAVAPVANAQEWKKRDGRDFHHSRQQPKGWGPHRGADKRGYYHGYRGYQERRAGYRRGHDGYWYPAAAFALGAVIGGGLNK